MSKSRLVFFLLPYGAERICGDEHSAGIPARGALIQALQCRDSRTCFETCRVEVADVDSLTGAENPGITHHGLSPCTREADALWGDVNCPLVLRSGCPAVWSHRLLGRRGKPSPVSRSSRFAAVTAWCDARPRYARRKNGELDRDRIES